LISGSTSLSCGFTRKAVSNTDSLKTVPHQDRVLTSMPEGTARFWRIPPALIEPIRDVAASLCGDLLKGDQAELTDDE
jgi:hypothetical protein